MVFIVPEQLKPEQQAVEAAIRKAFAGVTREGGVSWSESDVIDVYGTHDERAAARLRDTDTRWEEVADDPDWSEDRFGSLYCLDPIGFRYYLAAAMLRATRRGDADFLFFYLDMKGDRPDLRLVLISAFSTEQLRVTAAFIRFMMAVETARFLPPYEVKDWQNVYGSYWNRIDEPPVAG